MHRSGALLIEPTAARRRWLSALLFTALLACARDPVHAPDEVGSDAGVTPLTPIIEAAIPGVNSAQISFTQPDNAGSALVVSYAVACSGGGQTHGATGVASPITITGLTNPIVYGCTVTAVGLTKSSLPSAAVLVTPRATLFRLRLMLLDPGNGSASAVFDPPTPPGADHTVTCTGAGTTQRASGPSSPITVSSLSNGVAYSCSVRKTSTEGTEVSNSLTVVPGTPVRPLNPTTVSGNASATISFWPSTDNGSLVLGYTAICSATGQPSKTASGPSSPITVAELTNGVTYGCSAYASNALGPGQMSASVPVIPGTPSAPTSVSATAGSLSATFSFGAPVSVGGAPIDGYTVSCSDGRAIFPAVRSATGPTSPITLTGMAASQQWCSIWATNAYGNGVRALLTVTPLP